MMSDVSLVILERCAIKIVCREVCHSFQRIARVNEKPIAPNKSKCWPDFRGRQIHLKGLSSQTVHQMEQKALE